MKEQIKEMAQMMVDSNNKELADAMSLLFVRLAEVLYNAGYRKQEWISVDDRLPERNGRYLTHCNIENQSLVCVLYYCKIGGFNEGTVTHWMLIPEPPKMKGGAE